MMIQIRFHPQVSRDLKAIALWIVENAGSQISDRDLAEIEQTIMVLARMPHKGSVLDDIAPGLRAIPAGSRTVIAFTVDDAAEEVLIHAVTCSGGDWAGRSHARIF